MLRRPVIMIGIGVGLFVTASVTVAVCAMAAARVPATAAPALIGPRVTDGIGLTLVRVAPGRFLMGTAPGETVGNRVFEKRKRTTERQHPVTLTRAYWIGTTEVTRGQFAAFVAATNYRTDAERKGWAWARTGSLTARREGVTWSAPGFEQSDEHPVVYVSANDAAAFCRWLSERKGRRYRLPTEAEWEWACRAGAAAAYPWGDDPTAGAGQANLYDRSAAAAHAGSVYFNGIAPAGWADNFVATAPVGRFRANAFGLFDVLGNVRELTADGFAPFDESAATDPAVAVGAGGQVIKGGGFGDTCGFFARAGSRDGIAPDGAMNDLGFRVAADDFSGAPAARFGTRRSE